MEAVQTKLAIGNTVLGTYTAYTPTYGGLTVGNGTVVAEYARVNDFVHVYFSFILGSTSTVYAAPFITVPVSIDAGMISSAGGGADWVLGACSFTDVSANGYYFGYACSSAATQLRLNLTNVASTYAGKTTPNATVPFTWTTGDSLRFSVIYKAA
tara:strand:- start:332 stop:796 length:465 start_codon:yes stop_codon:yes gene_type:complete